MKDYVIKATSGNGEIRAYVGNTREMVEQARVNHNTTKVATAALGRTLTATSMMGLMMKNEKDELTVIIKGGGPIGTILATSDAKGMVRDYEGLSKDVSKLPHYVQSGSSALCLDTSELYEYHKPTDTWYRL